MQQTSPLDPMALAAGDIHVWTVPLDAPVPPITLPADEMALSVAVADARLRHRRHIARASLRTLIGLYLDQQPAGLRFRRDGGGKPRLLDGGLHFNLSHSDDVMLLALAADFEVGIDVDCLDRLSQDWRGVAQLCASAEELGELSTMAEADRSVATMRLWIRKEAYTKARGTGLRHPFPAVTVGQVKRHVPAPVFDQSAADGGGGWLLVDLPTSGRMAAALAFQGAQARVSYCSYQR